MFCFTEEKELNTAPKVVESLLKEHDDLRLNAINLIVSENRMTPQALAPLSSDIYSRYAAPFYAGTGPAQQLVSYAAETAKAVFKADYVNLSPISGNMSLLAAIFALTKSQDYVGRVPPFFPGGGYPLNYTSFERNPLPLAFSEETWQIDLPKTLKLLDEKRPPLVVLGSSIVTYPMPVREVAEVVHQYGGIVAYDGSHTLGLIAGGQYQDPLREGADILLGSTHKTFPGPQGGIILTNNEELHLQIDRMSNFTPLNGPTMICNPHLARIASMAIVLNEVNWKEYAAQIVDNARTIAATFKEEGIPLRGAQTTNFKQLTYCHQVLTEYSRSESIVHRDHLFKHRINVDGFLRIGTSEITRLGYKYAESRKLAKLLAALLRGESGLEIDKEIKELIASHKDIVM